ncbi:MAG: hypothetical protein DLM57_16550 [Pseudonocardiales bacterium]|nr:MAG: hypothetical protein DLM57_16550 [Pseudonocardiales bacterium]
MTTTLPRQQKLPGRAAAARTVRSRGSRRRSLLAWSAPVVLAAVMLAMRMIGMTIENDRGVDAFSKGSYGPSSTHFGRLQTANVLQRWVAPFNRGDSLFGQKRYAQAAAEFRTALGLAPADRTCMVRVNLVLAIESIGDAKVAAKSLPDAARNYQTALRTAAAASCPPGAARRTGERLAQARAEIAAKLEALSGQPQPSPGQPNPKPPQPQPPPDTKKTQLQQRNDKAQREDQHQRDQANQGQTNDREGW